MDGAFILEGFHVSVCNDNGCVIMDDFSSFNFRWVLELDKSSTVDRVSKLACFLGALVVECKVVCVSKDAE